MYGYSCLFFPFLALSNFFFLFLTLPAHTSLLPLPSPFSFLSLFSTLLRFAISSFLCGLHHEKKKRGKKWPVLWMWKEPVFNFWETHKSLSLLSYWPQNWKQMLPPPPVPFELPNYGVVKIKITLSISHTSACFSHSLYSAWAFFFFAFFQFFFVFYIPPHPPYCLTLVLKK